MEMADRLTCGDSHQARAGRSVLTRLVSLIRQWRERARQRRALLALDDRLLRDIGVGRAEAEEEARRAFWQP